MRQAKFHMLLLKIKNKCDALLPFLVPVNRLVLYSMHQKTTDVISVLSSRYADCAFVLMSAVEILKQFLENDQCLQSPAFLRSLQREIIVLFTLLTQTASDLAHLKAMFKWLITLSRDPFITACQMMKADILEENNYFFPCLPKIRRHPCYNVDQGKKAKEDEDAFKKERANCCLVFSPCTANMVSLL